jgi:ribosome-associated translation inhibitor RaiA
MIIQFQIRGMKDVDGMRRQLEADLEDLNRLIAVASTHVALERQRDVTPPYQAAVMLAVPGPDIHAAARDHTWLAAWRKVVTRLREQIEERRNQQTARKKSQPHIHSPAGRRAK